MSASIFQPMCWYHAVIKVDWLCSWFTSPMLLPFWLVHPIHMVYICAHNAPMLLSSLMASSCVFAGCAHREPFIRAIYQQVECSMYVCSALNDHDLGKKNSIFLCCLCCYCRSPCILVHWLLAFVFHPDFYTYHTVSHSNGSWMAQHLWVRFTQCGCGAKRENRCKSHVENYKCMKTTCRINECSLHVFSWKLSSSLIRRWSISTTIDSTVMHKGSVLQWRQINEWIIERERELNRPATAENKGINSSLFGILWDVKGTGNSQLLQQPLSMEWLIWKI